MYNDVQEAQAQLQQQRTKSTLSQLSHEDGTHGEEGRIFFEDFAWMGFGSSALGPPLVIAMTASKILAPVARSKKDQCSWVRMFQWEMTVWQDPIAKARSWI